MLTLTRRRGERFTIGSEIEVTVLSVSGNRVRIGINAPRDMAIYRGELVDKMEAENQRAVAAHLGIDPALAEQAAIRVEEGLFGMREHKAFLLCEIADDSGCRALVSTTDTTVCLLVVDATDVWPDYPVGLAKQMAGIDSPDVAIAAVVTAPADGTAVTVNLAAPIVIDVETRIGRQVILDDPSLGVRHLMVQKTVAKAG
jgi:carbon storage regulator CsrA